jgi:glycosyltransferase involved in cell wall biosynthesis
MLDPAQLTAYYDRALCEALAAQGHTVRFITSQHLYSDDLPTSPSYTLDPHYFRALEYRWLTRYPRLRRLLRGLSYPLDHWRLLQQARHTPPDIVHIQWSRVPRLDAWLIGQLKALDIPVVHTVHDIIPLYAPEADTTPWESVYSRSDRIILHAVANQNEFQQVYPSVNRAGMRMVPIIATPYTILPLGASPAAARQRLGVDADEVVFLFFGGIRQYKGLDILLDAFQQVDIPGATLRIAGLPENAEDERLVEQARHIPGVHVSSGYIPYTDLWVYHMAANVFMMPYRAITQSAALLTAMEFSLPIIATAVGALPESIDGNGWIVPPENPAALAAAMTEAARDRERLRQMSIRSRQLLDERHAGPAVAAQTLAVYRELVG